MFQMSRRKGRPLFRGRNPRQTTNISLKLNGNLDLPIAGLVVVSFVYPSSSLLYGPSANATTTADNNGSNVPPRNSSSLTHTHKAWIDGGNDFVGFGNIRITNWNS